MKISSTNYKCQKRKTRVTFVIRSEHERGLYQDGMTFPRPKRHTIEMPLSGHQWNQKQYIKGNKTNAQNSSCSLENGIKQTIFNIILVNLLSYT